MNTVVYYPHIYPAPNWLKLAALCWDKIYRMLPSDFHGDPDAIRKLDDTFGGILESIYVTDIADDKNIQNQFIKWVEERHTRLKNQGLSTPKTDFLALFPVSKLSNPIFEFLHKSGLAREEIRTYEVEVPVGETNDLFSISNSALTKYKPEILNVINIVKPESDRKKIHGKLKGGKAEKILQQKLVKVKKQSSDFYLPREIGLHYLSICAAKIAADGNRDLTTDGEEFTDVVFHNVRAVRGEVATSVLQAYLPENLSNLEPQRVAEVRSELATQRLKYQKAIQLIVEEYASIASEGELGKLKEKIQDLAKERIEGTKKACRRGKLELVTKAFSVTLTPPAVATWAASALGVGMFAPAGIAAALSLFAAGRLLEWDRAKEERAKSPWSYIIDTKKML